MLDFGVTVLCVTVARVRWGRAGEAIRGACSLLPPRTRDAPVRQKGAVARLTRTVPAHRSDGPPGPARARILAGDGRANPSLVRPNTGYRQLPSLRGTEARVMREGDPCLGLEPETQADSDLDSPTSATRQRTRPGGVTPSRQLTPELSGLDCVNCSTRLTRTLSRSRSVTFRVRLGSARLGDDPTTSS
jgi:hypothetical protein